MTKLPLPPHFFQCPPLSDTDTANLNTFAEQASIDAIRHARIDHGPISWSIVEDHHDLQVLCGQDRTAPAGVLTYCSVSHIFATIDDVAGLFRAETTDEYQAYRRNFATDLLDGAPLYTLTSPTPENPRQFVGVKWMAVASPAPAIVKPRDFCAIECRYDFDTQGKRGFVRCMKSVALACCPDLEATLGLVRGVYHRVAYVFLESDRPGYLHATQLLQINFHGKIPSWLSRLSAKKRAKALGDMELFLRGKRLTESGFLNDFDVVDKASRRRCFLCQRAFGAFGGKWSCRKCGEVVCKMCSKTWHVHADGMLQHIRVCTSCTHRCGASNTGQPHMERTKSLMLPVTPASREVIAASTTSASSTAGQCKPPRLTKASSAIPRIMYSSTAPTTASPTLQSFDFLNESILQVNAVEPLSSASRARVVDASTPRHRMQPATPARHDRVHGRPTRNTPAEPSRRHIKQQYDPPQGQSTGMPPHRLASTTPCNQVSPRELFHSPVNARNDIIPLVMSPPYDRACI